MALEQYRRAVGHGVRFAWLTFDEGYGGKPPFLRELDARGQNYVAEIPVSFVGWTVPPAVLQRELPRDRRLGRPRKFPRLKIKHTPACEVRDLLKYSPIVRRVEWAAYHVKDGEKGPMVWEAKCVPFWIKDEDFCRQISFAADYSSPSKKSPSSSSSKKPPSSSSVKSPSASPSKNTSSSSVSSGSPVGPPRWL